MMRIQLENRTDLKSEIPLEAPYCLFIDPSSACNFRCKFCMNSRIKDRQIMDMGLYRSIIDSLDEFDNPVKTVRLYGFGEPLINPHFCDMVKYAKASGKVINVDTTTNASLLTSDLNSRLVNSGIDRINISINGLSTKQYKEFTGCGVDFAVLVKTIEHLYLIKDKMTLFIKIDGDYLTEYKRRRFLEIFSDISDGCAIEHTMSCWYDVEVEVNNELGVYGQPREDVRVCPYIFYSMMIHSDGQASLCFLDWDKRLLIGDVKCQTVRQIWNSMDLKYFRFGMLKGIKNDICAKCDQLKAGMPVNLDDYADDILNRTFHDILRGGIAND